MAKQARRSQRYRRLRVESLERRHLLAALTLTTTADGMVADTNHDGVFDSVDSTSASISNRWFNPPTTPAQERGIFEFDLRNIAAGSRVDSASFSFHVQSFTSGDGIYPRFVLRAYPGDGAVTLADATAPAITLGTGEIRSLGVNSVEVNRAVLEPLLGQRLTVRLENTVSMYKWASLSTLETVTHGFRTQLVLNVSELKPLDVQISPNGFWESAGAGAATGTVTRTGDLSQPLTVSLSSSDTSSATVPATVTIPAGSANASFPIAAVDDFFADGDQVLTIAASASTSTPGPLALDHSYGIGGLARTSLLMRIQFPQAALVSLADGKVLAASEASVSSWQVTRLNADGTIDRTFGNNGIVTTSLVHADASSPIPARIAVQPNGDFLVGGSYTGGRGILVRYKANGVLDSTFGFNGIADLSKLQHTSQTAAVSDIALRADGRILLGFQDNGTVMGTVAQLNPNGTFDSTFGNGGVSRLHSSYRTGFGSYEIEILQDGSFLVAGAFQRRAGVVRVQSNGLGLVTSFGNNGIALADFDEMLIGQPRMLLDSQGRIVYSASARAVVDGVSQPADFAVARFLPNGAPDLSFAGTGAKIIDIANGSSDVPTSMIIQSGDKIVVGGVSIVSNVYDSALARLNEDGTLDASFDLDGRYRSSLVTTFTPDLIFELAQQADGKLLALTGWATDMRIARFHQPKLISAERNVTVYDDDPTAYSLELSIDEDRALIGPLLAIDPNGDPMQFSVVSMPSSGTVTINNPSAGSFTYVPDPNFHGTDSFTFRVNDGKANSNLATVVITVNPINDPPVVTPGTFTLPEDSPVGTVVGTVVASDVEDGGLSFSIVSGNTNNAFAIDAVSGEIRVANASALDFGTTPFFPLVVRVVDGGALSAQAEVGIFLTEVAGETTLELQVSPDGFWESAGAGAATGTVIRTGDLSQPLIVSLSSSDTSSATVPATVTIPAGSAERDLSHQCGP